MKTKNPRILVVNDDGIMAPGIAILEKVAKTLSDDVWVIAPERNQSGASRSITFQHPLRVHQLDTQRFFVMGTPTDCVVLALLDIMKDHQPDLVLSGVNYGQNVAEDIAFSGTVSAAMQSIQMGVPALAFSQSLQFEHSTGLQARWDVAEHFAPLIIEKLLKEGWPADVLMNINFPDCPSDQIAGMEMTVQGRHDQSVWHVDERTDPAGRHYYWLGYSGPRSHAKPGTDLYAIEHKRISITPLHVELTHYETLDQLKQSIRDIKT